MKKNIVITTILSLSAIAVLSGCDNEYVSKVSDKISNLVNTEKSSVGDVKNADYDKLSTDGKSEDKVEVESIVVDVVESNTTEDVNETEKKGEEDE